MAQEATRDLVLANLSWPEVAEIKDQVELVLQPVGSNEQHGPNLALCMDIASSFEFCRRASERLFPRVLVAPPVPWGVSFHHMNFPGTITLTNDTFIQVLVEVVASLHHHGFERFLFMNGHGGNIPALGVAAVRVHEEIGPAFVGAGSYFSFMDREIHKQFGATPFTGHACEAETARAMELIPQHVKYDTIAPGELTDLAYGFNQTLKKYNVNVPYRFDEITRNGALGDARIATPEYGKALVDSALDNFTAFVEELIANSPVETE